MAHSDQLQSIARTNAAANDANVNGLGSRTGSPDVVETAGPVSMWLYVAGLCVTLSGLYAVNYGQEAPAFATITYALAIAGYVSSYLLRAYRVGYESLRLPFLVLIGLGLFVWLSSSSSETGADARSVLTDRSHAMQILCVWIALLQPFAASTDAAVLFACVPCMSLIALVSTTNPDTEVQYAFLIFVGAATFLMVHENYLRTRRAAARHGAPAAERMLYGGQLQLALGCVLAAFLLANLVAIPMHAFGRSLQIANGWGQLNSVVQRPPSSLATQMANDPESLTIGGGPVFESETPVMRVESAEGGQWRGTTYDYYTGRAFENRMNISRRLSTVNEGKELNADRSFHEGNPPSEVKLATFRVLQAPSEVVGESGKGARRVEQTVTLLFPGISQCYGRGAPLTVSVPSDRNLECTAAGSVYSSSPFGLSSQYKVQSVVATEDEATLRAAGSGAGDIPPQIAERYLQVARGGSAEDARLRGLADQITQGRPTSYDKAIAIHDYIARTCKYNLQAPAAPPGSDRVEYFLLEGKQGYCDSFAASMTLLARYAGIPARVAAGYVMGEADGKGAFLVRQKDKHAWSELFFPKIGWVTFDATDTAVDISDHSQKRQARSGSFFGWLFSHGWLPPMLLAAMIGLLGYLIWTELVPRLRSQPMPGSDATPATNRSVIEAYLRACAYLERRGLYRPSWATPSEYLEMVGERLAALAPEAAESLRALTALHDRYRYGRQTATDAEGQQAADLAASMREALSRVPNKALQRSSLAAHPAG